jgi:ABC-2 type transport system permease protein
MTATAPATTPTPLGAGPTFARLLRSEWIKFRTLRSTFWCLIIILVISVGLSALLGAVLPGVLDSQQNAGQPGPGGASAAPDTVQSIAITAITAPTTFTALVAAVLGALMITGEFGTGMIRSTFAAAPGRIGAVLAKAVIVGASLFVVGIVSVALSTLIVVPMLGGSGHQVDLGDAGFWWALVGDAGYVAGVTLLSFFFGAIIRNSAGGIAVSLGLLLVVPIIMNVIVGVTRAADWAVNLAAVLPAQAGAQLYSYLPPGQKRPDLVTDGVLRLDPTVGGLILLAWVVVAAVVALVLVKRRDA